MNMEFWLMWIILWILFIIIEMFFATLDFLALWVSAIITWLIIWIIWWSSWLLASIIFIICAIFTLFITRWFILPKLKSNNKNNNTVSIDNMIWEKFIVQVEWWNKVVYCNWMFRNIKSNDKLHHWDTVEVFERDWNTLKVNKVM